MSCFRKPGASISISWPSVRLLLDRKASPGKSGILTTPNTPIRSRRPREQATHRSQRGKHHFPPPQDSRENSTVEP
jgi:hypothetical protein